MVRHHGGSPRIILAIHALRFPLALTLAVLVTAGFFLIMHTLISVRSEVVDAQAVLKIEFSRLRTDTPIEPRKRPKAERVTPKQEPPPPGMAVAQTLDPEGGVSELIAAMQPGVGFGEVTSLGGGGGGGGGGSGSRTDGSGERDVLPLVRVDPEYPDRARQQGLEGWVLVEFTISPAGTVKDPRVIEAQPASVFDREALNAIRRWRYSPRLENGVAVAQAGVLVRLRFELPRGR